MSKKKKIFIIFLSVFCLIIISLYLYFYMPYSVSASETQSEITINKDENLILSQENKIEILQLTDFHINDVIDKHTTYSIIKRVIYSSDPDIIVITGDIFSSGATEDDLDTFITFIEKFKIPWAVALGNHDDEISVPFDVVSDRLENAKYSLYKKGPLDDFYGNYYYNIKFKDNSLFQLIFLDSRRQGFTTDTINYYESVVVNTAKENNNTPINNFVFAHIPIIEFQYAAEQAQKGNTTSTGTIEETPSTQINNVPFFSKMKELNTTQAYICGHDHLNTLRAVYEGINLNYGIKTGISASNNLTIGGVMYNLKSNGKYTVKDKTIF